MTSHHSHRLASRPLALDRQRHANRADGGARVTLFLHAAR